MIVKKIQNEFDDKPSKSDIEKRLSLRIRTFEVYSDQMKMEKLEAERTERRRLRDLEELKKISKMSEDSYKNRQGPNEVTLRVFLDRTLNS